MKLRFISFLTFVLVCLMSCEQEESDYALTTFDLDSANVNMVTQQLNAVHIGTWPENNTVAFRAQNGLGGVPGKAEYSIEFMHFNDSFTGAGEYIKSKNTDALLIHSDYYDKNATQSSYFYKKVDSLWLKYTEVNKDIIKGEFYLEISSEDDPTVTYTLSNGKFEFANYEDKFY